MRVSVVATGIEADLAAAPKPMNGGFNLPKSSPVVQAAVEAATRRSEESLSEEAAPEAELEAVEEVMAD